MSTSEIIINKLFPQNGDGDGDGDDNGGGNNGIFQIQNITPSSIYPAIIITAFLRLLTNATMPIVAIVFVVVFLWTTNVSSLNMNHKLNH